jgi:hypothetical protein
MRDDDWFNVEEYRFRLLSRLDAFTGDQQSLVLACRPALAQTGRALLRAMTSRPADPACAS